VTGLPERIALDGDPLDPIGGGDRIGYARVSTRDQNLRRQVAAGLGHPTRSARQRGRPRLLVPGSGGGRQPTGYMIRNVG
jgi:hypothetical protein